jgi:hypothetical protein
LCTAIVCLFVFEVFPDVGEASFPILTIRDQQQQFLFTKKLFAREFFFFFSMKNSAQKKEQHQRIHQDCPLLSFGQRFAIEALLLSSKISCYLGHVL